MLKRDSDTGVADKAKEAARSCLSNTRWIGGVTIAQALCENVGTLMVMESEKQQMRRPHKSESNNASLRGGLTRISSEGAVMELEQRSQLGTVKGQQQQWMNAQEQQKEYDISQEEVLEAWHNVQKKGGVGGVDGIGIKDFEKDLNKNLYKLWNRMSSGSYHPKAVMRVEIPKNDGKMRPLGIPTIMDRVAQEVVRRRLEPTVEGFFHRDSYGFRPNKSAPEAVKVCRERCWRYDWVLDVDIQKFFDTIDHELMMKAVYKHCKEKWILLYIERWLKAAVQHRNGVVEQSQRGTPQGGVISPLLANLYLHYAFDGWMARTYPNIKFERYADDIVIHCSDEAETEQIRDALATRLSECGLTLHPEKTKVVYCRDGNRKGMYPTKKFTFLGFGFQARKSKNHKTKENFIGFLPAVSEAAKKKFRDKLKEKRIFKMTQSSPDELADILNPISRGWYKYFIHCYPSALRVISEWLDNSIIRWLKRKYLLRWGDARRLLIRLRQQTYSMFAHWSFCIPRRAV